MKQDDATFVANTAELLRAHGYTVTPPSMADSMTRAEVHAAMDRAVGSLPPAPFHSGQTVDAATAWEAMGRGWIVGTESGMGQWFLGSEGKAWYIGSVGEELSLSPSRGHWELDHRESKLTLIRIHPDAHQHALQRLLAAGLKVGSRVEVVHHEHGNGTESWQDYSPVGSRYEVLSLHHADSAVQLSNGYYAAAHCVRLLPAEQDAPAPNPEDQVPPATTGEGVRDLHLSSGGYELDIRHSVPTPEDFPTRWVPEPTKWYVWSREAGPPNVKHATHAEAKAEAERLAAKHPGREFKVLGQVGENVVVDPPPRFKKGDRVLIEGVIDAVVGNDERPDCVSVWGDFKAYEDDVWLSPDKLLPVAASEGGGE